MINFLIIIFAIYKGPRFNPFYFYFFFTNEMNEKRKNLGLFLQTNLSKE